MISTLEARQKGEFRVKREERKCKEGEKEERGKSRRGNNKGRKRMSTGRKIEPMLRKEKKG